MRAAQAVELIQQALLAPVETWPGYSPRAFPVCVYDKDEHYFLNHPEPPQGRPPELTAATACEIGGLMTAVIPADICSDERSLIPLLYHECFHAHQNRGAFRFAEKFDFFRCLAYYPELNAQYRALCAAEAEVLANRELHPRHTRPPTWLLWRGGGTGCYRNEVSWLSLSEAPSDGKGRLPMWSKRQP